MILPDAEATMSIWPNEAHNSAKQNTAMTVAATARPAGDAGVSTTSSAAGRKATSAADLPAFLFGRNRIFLSDFMYACLQPIKHRVTAPRTDQFVVGSILDDSTLFNRDDAVCPTHGG